MVIVDYYSRFFEVVIMQSTTTEKIIGALIPIFARYGYPFSVKSDNGSQFQSEEFKSFLLEHGIEHHTSPPLWPQANGDVERQNRTLLKALKVAHVEGKGWKGELMKFLLAYRTTPQVSVTPAYLMFGRELKKTLLELRSDKNILDENVRDCGRRGAMLNPVLPGEQVLLKNTKTSGKVSTNFIETAVFCGKQNLPLRGHRDDRTSTSSNKRNFWAILEMMAKGDDTLRKHLATGRKMRSIHK